MKNTQIIYLIFIIIICFYSCNINEKNNLSIYQYMIPDQIDDGIEVSSLNDEGVDQMEIELLVDKVINGTYKNVGSILIMKNGKLILEAYFNGSKRDKLHDIRSATKSLTSILVGIAIDKNMINNLDIQLFDYFPEYINGVNDFPKRNLIKLKHVLTSTMGLDIDHASGKFTRVEDFLDPNWLENILNSPILHSPGTWPSYSSASASLWGPIISRATGEPFAEFAKKNFFDPLGIKNYQWLSLSDGSSWSGGSLKMISRDMAKLGQLCLNKGRWGNQEIVSAEWIDESTKKHVVLNDYDMDYGYYWWIYNFGGKYPCYFASGNGGQHIFVFPTLNMVVIETEHNYESDKNSAFEMIYDHIIPSVL